MSEMMTAIEVRFALLSVQFSYMLIRNLHMVGINPTRPSKNTMPEAGSNLASQWKRRASTAHTAPAFKRVP